MSEQISAPENTQTEITAGIVEEKVKPVEMTAENFNKWEHAVQVGATELMPNGQSIADFQKESREKQIEQEKARIEAAQPGSKKTREAAATVAEAKPDTPLNVTVHGNGAVSVEPKVEETEGEKSAVNNLNDDKEPDNDIPADYPHRDKLIAAGHLSLEKVAKFTLDDLKGIDGIGPKSAEAILNYGKSV